MRTSRSLRSALIVVCAIATMAAAHFSEPSMLLHDDPELARLLRGMALIKAAIALTAMAACWWRFGQPVQRIVATIDIVGAGLMVWASVSIWRLTALLPAAVLFHAGLFALLLVALRLDEDAKGKTHDRPAMGRSR